MKRSWEAALQRWVDARLVDAEAAARILEFESRRETQHQMRWPAIVAWSFGGLMLAAGVLLFVAANWDNLSPAGRLFLVLSGVALFHIVGALVSNRQQLLSQILHAVGTTALGAGIFLAGQIFHLQEHWPGGFLLWALGAWMGWLLLRDWLQLALAALLTPIWLLGEWSVATELSHGSQLVTAQAMLLLAMTYFTALRPGRKTFLRISLTWVGGLALIPSTLFLVADVRFRTVYVDLPLGFGILGWSLAYVVPLALAYLLRGKTAWMNLIGAGWVLLMALPQPYSWTPYVLCAAFSVFLIWWGFQDERRERVNLGVAGFALTLLAFYFSSIMDKLDRALSLILLGILFLVLGWAMTRLRGYLMERFEERLS